MMKGIENYGGVGTHWALGSIVLVVLAASEYSGAGTLVALPVTAIAVSFAGILINILLHFTFLIVFT